MNACGTTHFTPAYTLTKSSDPVTGSTVQPGDTVAYTLSVTNTSDAVLTGAVVTDNLADVLDNSAFGAVPTGATLTGTTLSWTVPRLEPGKGATLTYRVTIDAGAYSQTIGNVATPGPGGECVNPCATTHFTPGYTLSKTSDPVTGSTVQPGDTVAYTLTVTNTSDAVLTGAVVTDDLADVLDDAAFGAAPAGATLTGTTLSWTVPTLQPDEVVTLTYQVTVDADAYDRTIGNVVTPGPGGRCVLDCDTTHYTPGYTLTKSSDPVTGSTVQPGTTVDYTLTVTNTSDGVVDRAVVTDDLADVLDNATLGAVPAAAVVAGSTLTWTVPTLQPGGIATITYPVIINADAFNQTIGNVATPGPGGACVTDCETTHVTPGWTLTKTSDPVSGSTVQRGETVDYTLRVANTSNAVVDTAVVTDDLTAVLNHASFGDLPAGATLDEAASTLTWTVPVLNPDEDATLTYSVTIDDDDAADNQTIGNVATPGPGGECVNACSTTHITPDWTLTKTSDPVSGSTVRPGDTILYTLTATNIADNDAVLDGVLVTDDLTNVLDHASFGDVPEGATLRDAVLTWRVPRLAAGSVATLQYHVTLDDDAVNVTIRNVATPGPGGECVPASSPPEEQLQLVLAAAIDPDCSTTHATPDWTLRKSSDPESGSVVQPGSAIVYTLTVANVSTVTVDDAVVTDDLSRVLNHGTLDAVPDGTTLSGTTLTWPVPVLEPGDEATLSYRVTLDADAVDVTVENVVTPGSGGRCVVSCTTNHETPPTTTPPTTPPPTTPPPTTQPPTPPATTPPAPPVHRPFLPNTGGPGLAILGVGVLLLAGGGLLLRSRRRRG